MKLNKKIILSFIFGVFFAVPTLIVQSPISLYENFEVSSYSYRRVQDLRVSFADLFGYYSSYSSIYDWHQRIEEMAEQHPDDFTQIKIGIIQGDAIVNRVDFSIPKVGVVSDYTLVEKYVATVVQNMLSIFGATEVVIEADDDIVDGVKRFINDDLPGANRSLGSYLSEVYGDFNIGVAAGSLDDYPEYSSAFVTAVDPATIKGYHIGIDMGGSSIKVILIGDGGKILRSKTYGYDLSINDCKYTGYDQYQEAGDYVNKLDVIVEDFLQDVADVEIKDVRSMGVSWAGAVDEFGSIVGRSKLVGNLSDREFNNIGALKDLLTQRTGIPTSVINDGSSGALWAASQQGQRSALVLGLGTSLAGGYIDSKGNFPLYLLELSKTTIDMSQDAYIHSGLNLHGVLQQRLSLNGALHLADEKGFQFPAQYADSKSKFRYLKERAEYGDAMALDIFSTLGIYAAEAIIEFSRYLDFDTVVAFGGIIAESSRDSMVTTNVRDIVLQNAEIVLRSRGFSNITIYPLKQDSSYSAALGAVYCSFADLEK